MKEQANTAPSTYVGSSGNFVHRETNTWPKSGITVQEALKLILARGLA